jgi:hypothetical protein
MTKTGLDCDPPLYASHIAGTTGAHHHVQLLYWLRWGSYELFAQVSLEP